MNSIAIEVYKQIDPDKKDKLWGDRTISILRQYWQSLVSPQVAAYNKALLLSLQDMKKIRASFKDKEFLENVDLAPLGIMENFRNTIIEELIKSPPAADIRAVDPTAQNMREADVALMKNRQIIEKDLTQAQLGVGLPPYKVSYDNFKGNVKEFDKMGLDPNDTDDVNFYTENFQRLNFEIAGQSLINNVLKGNRFDESTINDLVTDILANKVCCIQTYVDKMTGEIKCKYIYPETAMGIFGESADGKGDICRGWQDSVTVMQFLQMAGNHFDFERDWRKLLWAVNYCNSTKFTGFVRYGQQYNIANPQYQADCETMNIAVDAEPFLLGWNIAYTYKIFMGYIEWNTVEATGTYLKKHSDPSYAEYTSYDVKAEEKGVMANEDFYKESFYQQQWYCSFFIATTSVTQWLYDYSKVYYQRLEGANDEYSNGTLCYYRERGIPAVQIARPYINMANFAFYRMLWAIYHSKPQSEEYLVEELIQVSKAVARMYPQTAGENSVPTFDNFFTKAIQYMRENVVKIRAFPQIDGKTIAQLPPQQSQNAGMDPISIAMQSVVMWAEAQIAAKIGMNPIRYGFNPPARESYKSEQSSVNGSFNSTGYIYRMVQFTKERFATASVMYAQMIVKYKDSIPYRWLMRLVGNEVMEGLALLEEFSAHRMGVFVRDENTKFDKDRIVQAADFALQSKMIDYAGWFIVTQTEDPKLGNRMLQFLTLKKEKKLRQQQVEDFQMQTQASQQTFQQQIQLQQLINQGLLQKQQLASNAMVQGHNIDADADVQTKQMMIQSEPIKLANKAENQKDVDRSKEDYKNQAPLPNLPEGQ